MFINQQLNDSPAYRSKRTESNSRLTLPMLPHTAGGHTIASLPSSQLFNDNNYVHSTLSSESPKINDILRERLKTFSSAIQVIKDECSLQSTSGIPFKFIPQFNKLLSSNQCAIAIAIRKVEKPALKYLLSGHPTKNFHIKGKSSNWGPHQGLIPVMQQYSKLAGKATLETITKYNQDVNQCIADGFAVSVPFTMTNAEIKQQKNTKVINGNTEWSEVQNNEIYCISARYNDDHNQWDIFIDDQRLDVLAYPQDWKCRISLEHGEKLQSWMSEHLFDLYHESNYGKSYLTNRNEGCYLINIMNDAEGYTIDKDCIRLMKALTSDAITDSDLSFSIDSITIIPTPCMSKLPITADLDLFGVYSDADSFRKEPLYPQEKLPRTPCNMTPMTRNTIGKTECINAGNITREICDIIHTINSGIGNEVIQHSAESNNPHSGDMADNLPVVFVLSDAFKSKMEKVMPEFSFLFDKKAAAISIDDVNAVSALTSIFTEENMFGAWRSAWNKETLFEKTPVNGHAIYS